MYIYLAARYSRRKELLNYRADLEKLGHEVTSRWLDGPEQLMPNGERLGTEREYRIESDSGRTYAALKGFFSIENMHDMYTSDIMINFTEPPGTASSGGRHVEYGYMLALDRPIVVVGYHENIFHWYPDAIFREDWNEVLKLPAFAK